MIISSIPSAKLAWARYCSHVRDDVPFSQYAVGYALLSDNVHASEWLQRGFEEMLKAIRNSEGHVK